MEFGICLQYFIPMRLEDSDRAEMVSQVLFGETFSIISRKNKFSFVKLGFDGYEGWVDSRSIHHLDEIKYQEYIQLPKLVLHQNITIVPDSPGLPILKAGAGSTLALSNGILKPDLDEYSVPEKLKITENDDSQAALIRHSRHFLSVPYLWGGRSDMGIDCSGFVQNLYKQIGICLPRDASQQVQKGRTINFISEAQQGDLAFFDNEDGAISHVGMLLSTNRIIHASGQVKIDHFDHQGIYSEKENNYSHKLRIIKRIL
jgi:hypothetical protein